LSIEQSFVILDFTKPIIVVIFKLKRKELKTTLKFTFALYFAFSKQEWGNAILN
jgi:hypothetical protein